MHAKHSTRDSSQAYRAPPGCAPYAGGLTLPLPAHHCSEQRHQFGQRPQYCTVAVRENTVLHGTHPIKRNRWGGKSKYSRSKGAVGQRVGTFPVAFGRGRGVLPVFFTPAQQFVPDLLLLARAPLLLVRPTLRGLAPIRSHTVVSWNTIFTT